MIALSVVEKTVKTSKTEPRQRKDGKCVLPKCRKAIPLVGLRNGDPFCSSACCRKHYEVEGAS